MACWFNSDSSTAAQDLFSLVPDTGTNDGFRLRAGGDLGGDPVQMKSREGGAEDSCSTSSGYTTGTWTHALGIVAGIADRRVYINGGSKGTDTTSRDVTLASTSKVSVGAYRTDNTFNETDGRVAECAIWNVALTDADALVLAAGYSPLFVRPDALVFYAPLVRHLNDVKRGVALTATGAVVADHPRIIMPKRRQPYSVTAAGGTFKPFWAVQNNSVVGVGVY